MTNSRPLRIFLCHAKEDKPTVRELYRQLTAEGWLDVWLDEQNLLPGQEWDIEIEKAVEQADVVVVCLSNKSIDKEGYVQKELRFVLNIADEKPEGTIFVIPLRLDDCIMPRRLRAWQWVDYFPKENQESAYRRLLKSLELRAAKLGIESLDYSTKEDQEQLARERIEAVQKDEAEGKAKEEAQRLAAQKAKEEQLAHEKMKAERKAEAERKAKDDHERLIEKREITAEHLVAKSDVQKQTISKHPFLLLWKGRILLGAIFGICIYLALVFFGLLSGNLASLVGCLLIYGVTGFVTFPHKFSIYFFVLGFLIAGTWGFIVDWSDARTFIGYGVLPGIPLGAFISRILHWLKIIK